MVRACNGLNVLNAQAELDFFTSYNEVYRDDNLNDDPFFGVNLNSNFHDIESLADICKQSKRSIYLSLNVQSLMSKHEKLAMEISELEQKNVIVDVIAIQEIWDIRYPELVSLDGFNPIIFKKRRNMRGGGVGFYIRKGLNAEIIENLSPFENKIIETLTLRLTYPNSKIVFLTCIYRSNGTIANVTATQQLERFMETFSQILSDLKATNKPSYVFLDSNINLLHLQNADAMNYLNCIFDKGYLQIIAKASRIQNNSKTLIDHILTNTPGLSICSGTLISDVSDHFFTFVMPHSESAHKQPHRTVTSRVFSNQKLLGFRDELAMADWTSVTNKLSVDEAYNEFWKSYIEAYNRNFPLKRQRFNKNIHKLNNFMTRGLLISRNTKNTLHKASVTVPTAENIQKYKNFKTIYQRVLRGAKKLYFTSKLEENVGNPKKTWETLNEILGKSRKSETIEKINVNGTPITDPEGIANEFNTFFTSAGQQISDNVRPVNKPADEYVNYDHAIPDLLLQNTTPEHVKKIIRSLKPKLSSDVQGVSTKMVKFVGNEIAVPLSYIFNLSLESGNFPSKLKLCRVIPIFKAGDSLECDNYRPISLLSSISKILEKIVAQKLVSHLTSNDLLYCHQYGFLSGRSTEHNLMQILNFITNALNDGNFCIAVFLDLRKAFDVCNHEILLKKLEKMGIRGTAYNWFKNYLAGRSQFVDINGNRSDALNINISVIQGSILGPILFLCYINDFYRATTLFTALFADDTTGLGKGKNLNELTAYVNVELQKIANWLRSNKMAINTKKTKFIVFRTRGKRIDPDDCLLVYNDNEIGIVEDPNLIYPITRVFNDGAERHFKLLGVLFDEFLSFDDHIDSLCTKISKSLFCLNRIKNFVTNPALKSLYYAMVHSHISYCINIYGCATPTALNKLVIKQKEAIRIVCRSGYRDHTNPLFKQSGILPLNDLIQYSALKFMHKFKHNKLPFSFNETWITNRARNIEIALRNTENLYVPAHKLATLKRFPLFSFPKIWNQDTNDKLNPSLKIYLKNLKSAYLNALI